MDYIIILTQKLEQWKLGLIRLIPEMIIAVLAFIFFLFVARFTRRYSQLYLLRRTDDILLAKFLSKTVFSFVVIFGFVVSLGVLGLSGAVTKILAGAGISGFIIGFAFKDIGENFLAGILLAFKRPFRIGDTIETGGLKGAVFDFKLRETLIKTSEGVSAFIPNSIIVKNVLKNHTMDHLLRKEFVIGIDYKDDIRKAVEIISTIVKNMGEVEKDPKEPVIVVSDFGEKYMYIKVFFWLRTSLNGAMIQSEIMNKILDELKAGNFNFERK